MQSTSLATAGAVTCRLGFPTAIPTLLSQRPLEEVGYGDVTLTSDLHEKQLHDTHTVLMALSEDSLLKPFREMAGMPSPGEDLGGWYHYDPDYDSNAVDAGFAPAATSTKVSLTQRSGYPLDGAVKFDITVSRTTEFAIHLRIPAWAEGTSIFVNGKPVSRSEVPGKFVTIRRAWKKGDRIEMDLPMRLRLEAIDKQHPQIVALLCGPLVLFAITDAPPVVTARQLLAAKKAGQQSWRVETASGTISMLPFTTIADQQYSTYLIVK